MNSKRLLCFLLGAALILQSPATAYAADTLTYEQYKGGSGYLYTVYPLENPDDASKKYSLDSAAAGKAAKSYERTKAIVTAGLTECQQAIGCEITFKQ